MNTRTNKEILSLLANGRFAQETSPNLRFSDTCELIDKAIESIDTLGEECDFNSWDQDVLKKLKDRMHNKLSVLLCKNNLPKALQPAYGQGNYYTINHFIDCCSILINPVQIQFKSGMRKWDFESILSDNKSYATNSNDLEDEHAFKQHIVDEFWSKIEKHMISNQNNN